MPSGAFVELYPFTWRRGMNVYVNLPPEDQGKTDGLCGTFDRDRSNDMKMSDGSFIQGTQYSSWYWSWYRYSYSDINRFVKSWRYSTNHVYLHRPNAFGFWQTRFELFWIGLRIRNAFGMNGNCTFCVCLFSQILIGDLWALGGFSFGFGFSLFFFFLMVSQEDSILCYVITSNHI